MIDLAAEVKAKEELLATLMSAINDLHAMIAAPEPEVKAVKRRKPRTKKEKVYTFEEPAEVA